MTGKYIAYLQPVFWRRCFLLVMVLLPVGIWGTANAKEIKETTKTPYVGTWKLEKVMPQPDQEWITAKYPFIMQLLANGDLEILIPAPNKTIRITGTWKLLDAGHLQVSQEGENGKAFERPSIIVFTLKNGKLISSARPYVNENEKAQPGFIFKKE